MIGNDMKLDTGVGTCGKNGQSVPVGVGQPTLRLDGLTVGGTVAGLPHDLRLPAAGRLTCRATGFRQKKFGYGATPNTWLGWLFTIAGAVLTLAVIIAADFMRDDGVRLVLIAVGLPLVLVPTVLISHAKTRAVG